MNKNKPPCFPFCCSLGWPGWGWERRGRGGQERWKPWGVGEGYWWLWQGFSGPTQDIDLYILQLHFWSFSWIWLLLCEEPIYITTHISHLILNNAPCSCLLLELSVTPSQGFLLKCSWKALMVSSGPGDPTFPRGSSPLLKSPFLPTLGIPLPRFITSIIFSFKSLYLYKCSILCTKCLLSAEKEFSKISTQSPGDLPRSSPECCRAQA